MSMSSFHDTEEHWNTKLKLFFEETQFHKTLCSLTNYQRMLGILRSFELMNCCIKHLQPSIHFRWFWVLKWSDLLQVMMGTPDMIPKIWNGAILTCAALRTSFYRPKRTRLLYRRFWFNIVSNIFGAILQSRVEAKFYTHKNCRVIFYSPSHYGRYNFRMWVFLHSPPDVRGKYFFSIKTKRTEK